MNAKTKPYVIGFQSFSERPAGVRAAVQSFELRWHYSQHYAAECQGEAVIEDILQHTYAKKQRNILAAQLKDEKEHSNLFAKIVQRLGYDERASGYAGAYAKLVQEQDNLPAKIFAFQILTEAVSAGYCQWRLNNFQDAQLNQTDEQVRVDEVRHLNMGKCMLAMCESDDIEVQLPKEKRLELIRAINDICRNQVNLRMQTVLKQEFNMTEMPRHKTSLDREILRAIRRETSRLDPDIDLENILTFYG